MEPELNKTIEKIGIPSGEGIKVKDGYEPYLFTFIDFLGFKNNVSTSVSSDELFSKLKGLLFLFQTYFDQFIDKLSQKQDIFLPSKIKPAMFSDTITFATQGLDDNSIITTLTQLNFFYALFIGDGFFGRGAIASGLHYQKNKIMFGPAVIEATQLEKLANWPRIVLHPNIMKHFLESSPELTGRIQEYEIMRDEDGLQYVNYLQSMFVFFKDIHWFIEIAKIETSFYGDKQSKIYEYFNSDYISKHHQAIINGIDSNKSQGIEGIKIETKYHALAIYHNGVIDNLCHTIKETSKLLDANNVTDLAKLHAFHLPFLGKLMGAGHDDKILEFLRKKLKELNEKLPALVENKIDLENSFPLLYK